MMKNTPIYTSLCSFFAVLIVTSNLIYQKFVALPLVPGYTWELSIGAMSYPLTFLISDLIAEFYGKKAATFCVKLGIAANILVALLLMGFDKLDTTAWSPVSKSTFHTVFGHFDVAFIGSVIACYTAQFVDIILYLWIRKLTGGKNLWIRNTVSTSISLFIDTVIVIGFMSIFEIIPWPYMIPTLISSYSFKLFFTLCSSPVFYLAVKYIQYLQKRISSPLP